MHLQAYRLIARVVHRLPLGAGRLSQSIAGRRDAVGQWIRWAAERRSDGQLVWIHASSVGEALVAQPVVVRLRAALPALQVIHTYSSPAAARWSNPFEAHGSGYVPLDEPGPVARVLDAIRPSLLTVARGDLWPELVMQTAARGIGVAVFGASVRPDSRRLRRPLRPLYARMHRAVSWLGAVSPQHAARWVRLGVPASAVQVTGDPRHDQVLERVPELRRLGTLLEWSAGGTTLVAGSTRVKDNRVLLRAAREVFREHPNSRLLVIPHEPTDENVGKVLRQAEGLGLAASVWTSTHDPPEARCVIVQELGLLFDLYALGAMAYVGGGFHKGQLHAVIEPAAYGLPVVMGPHYQWSDDARALIDSGGGTVLPERDSAAALATCWGRMTEQDDARAVAGLAARRTLHSGAATQTVTALLGLLKRRQEG